MYHLDDTIVAIASAHGGAHRGVVRLSGPSAVECVSNIVEANRPEALVACRTATAIQGYLSPNDWCAKAPCAVYVWPNRRSYTRQPVVEIHTVGSPPLLAATQRDICQHGARLAEPGEFTMRAFLAGRLDLTQAEAVMGVIDAASKQQLDIALQQLSGGLATPIHAVRDTLLDLLADLEAGLDFVDEDIELLTKCDLDRKLHELEEQVARILAQMTSRIRLADAPRVVLFGSPNVGKSSLLNALSGHSSALVSEIPGTTRDYVTRLADLNGCKCEFIDTAGIVEESEGRIANSSERMAIPSNPTVSNLLSAAQWMSEQQIAQADLEVFCIDATRQLNEWEQDVLKTTKRGKRLVVLTKGDLPGIVHPPESAIVTSSKTGTGVPSLKEAIVQIVARDSEVTECVVNVTAARCRVSVHNAQESLQRALEIVTNNGGDELIACEIRMALDELGKVAGAVYTDDILDRIFSRFCIGK